jgi:hypothetical protein
LNAGPDGFDGRRLVSSYDHSPLAAHDRLQRRALIGACKRLVSSIALASGAQVIVSPPISDHARRAAVYGEFVEARHFFRREIQADSAKVAPRRAFSDV